MSFSSDGRSKFSGSESESVARQEIIQGWCFRWNLVCMEYSSEKQRVHPNLLATKIMQNGRCLDYLRASLTGSAYVVILPFLRTFGEQMYSLVKQIHIH